MGNPTVASGQNPADRARAMGLQSKGNGSYVDQSGNVVARTVNNELVFYDDGMSGGAGKPRYLNSTATLRLHADKTMPCCFTQSHSNRLGARK